MNIGAIRPHAAARHGLLGVLAISGLARPVLGDIVSWNTGDGSWSNPASWTPWGVPGANDTARLGNLAGVQGAQVVLSQDDIVIGLDISDGCGLLTEGYTLLVNGDTTLSDSGDFSRLNVSNAGPGADFDTQDLVISDVSRLQLDDGHVRVRGQLLIGPEASLGGDGHVEFTANGMTTMSVDGDLLFGPGATPSFVQIGSGVYDLDGVTGNGFINLNVDASITFTGDALSDPFNGSFNMGAHARVTMNIQQGWEAAPGSSIRVNGTSTGAPAEVRGSSVTLAGDVGVYYDHGMLRITAPATIEPSFTLILSSGNWIEFAGDATVEGGEFNVNEGASVAFTGDTVVRGGEFFGLEGGAIFAGPTEWDGGAAFHGSLQQVADASVTGSTSIYAHTMDLDGPGGFSSWAIDASLVIDTHEIDYDNVFDGTIDIGGGIAPRLTIDLLGAGAAWTMAGVMNLRGLTHLWETRVAGSPMIVEGQLNVADGKVVIAADTVYSGAQPATVTIGPADAVLRMTGTTSVGTATSFAGQGTLRNAGDMTLDDGLTLGPIGLVNDGVLRLGAPAGVASVHRFENTGTIAVSLGGDAPGGEHDLLIASEGPAVLGGELEIELADLGGGVFKPVVGDEFTILTAVGGVSGAFGNQPKSGLGGLTYVWAVEYEPSAVVLRLDRIEGCPADLAPPFGVLNIFDFLRYQTLFSNGDPGADLAAPFGVLNLFDFLAYQTAFGNGC